MKVINQKQVAIVLLLLSAVIGLNAVSFAQWPVEKEVLPETGAVLENDYVRFEFEETNMGLKAMIDKVNGINHIHTVKGRHLLWELQFRSGAQRLTLNNNEFPCSTVVKEELKDGTQRLILTWKNFRLHREDWVHTITVTVELPKESGIAQWSINADNNSHYWGLWEVRFPYVTGYLEKGSYDVAVSLRVWGKLFKNLSRPLSSRYPRSTWQMQFLSASRGNMGVYMAALDGQARTKEYYLSPGDSFYFLDFAENMGMPGSDFPAPYKSEFGVYSGGWMQAAKMYRKWAVNQYWISEGPLSQRESVPDIVKNVGLWIAINDGTENFELNRAVIDAQDYLGVPLAIHWYRWHEVEFDQEYPHYIPAKRGFKERVVDLVNHGILVMPYINGRLYDQDNDDWDEAFPFATKDEGGVPYQEIYGTNSGRLVPMCPWTEYWQDKIAGIVNDLYNLYGVSGVYLDQISSAAPTLCFDQSHGHPLGGGGWWVSGSQRLLTKVQQVSHMGTRELVITTEDGAEPYMNKMDAHLMPSQRTDIEIPLLTAVYSGYSLYFGSPNSLAASDRAFRMVQGRDFAWGCQNGWIWPGEKMIEGMDKGKAEYFRAIGQSRIMAKKFLTYGELMDVLRPAKEIPQITENWRDENKGTLPCVMGALWKAEDGNLGIFITNFLDEPFEYSYDFNPARYGLKADSDEHYVITHLRPEGDRRIGIHYAGKSTRTESLAPREIRVLEISVNKN